MQGCGSGWIRAFVVGSLLRLPLVYRVADPAGCLVYRVADPAGCLVYSVADTAGCLV